MGWWGYQPMEGDTPLDYVYRIEEQIIAIANSMRARASLPPITREQYDEGYEAYVKLLQQPTIVRQLIDKGDTSEPVWWHVLGTMVIEAGGDIEQFRQRLLDSIGDEIIETRDGVNGWDKPEQRIAAMRTFQHIVIGYKTGDVVVFDNKRLLDKLLRP